jgi:hypothetical protein
MWRRTERASVGKEAFNQGQPGAMLGSEGKFEAVGRLFDKPAFRLLGDVRGMIGEAVRAG